MTEPSRGAQFETMATLYKSGKTLREIGIQFNCTGEFIRQCLRKIGVTPSEGGRQKIRQMREASRNSIAIWTREMLVASRNERSLKEWGCDWDQYAELSALQKPIFTFKQQRASAGKRGIGWELSLWQWWTIWQESGKWGHRGCGQGYVMCRKGDVGPYAVGNVFIATARQNSSDQISKKSNFPMGVRKVGNSFEARRKLNGKTKYLGCHRTPELAHAAYLSAGDTSC